MEKRRIEIVVTVDPFEAISADISKATDEALESFLRNWFKNEFLISKEEILQVKVEREQA